MRPRGETQRRYNEAIQSLSGKKAVNKSIKYTSNQEVNVSMAIKRRQACPQTVLHLWDAINYVRQQKQIPNFDRLASYMKRVHNLNPPDLERQLKFAVNDGLVVVKTTIGCKGTKVGVEQDGYRIPEEEVVKDGHDWYCFECHRGGEVLLCSTCYRVYHHVCIKEDLIGTKFVCTICNMQKNKFMLKIKKNDLNTLLGYTCIRLKEKTKELHRIPHPDEERWRHDLLVYQQMDLVVIEDKMRSSEYQRLEDFHADTLQVVHNIAIYFGVHSSVADMARRMLRDCDYDLNEIKQCQECYRMSNKKEEKFWFCHPCDPPHELVFAKQKGFPFWPAKVIKKENNVYDVRFFGCLHQRAKLEQQYVKPITSSLQQLGTKRTGSLTRALEELKRHQELVAELLAKKSVLSETEKSLNSIDFAQVKIVVSQEEREAARLVGQNKVHSVNKIRQQQLTPERRVKSGPITPPESKSKSSPTSDRKNRAYLRAGKVTALEQKTPAPRPRGRPASSGSSVSKPPPAKKRKFTKDNNALKKVNGEFSHDESPSSSSPKTDHIQNIPTPEDHNVVSSSCQETVSCVSVTTQTPRKLLTGHDKEKENEPTIPPETSAEANNQTCDCSSKYSKIFKDFREHLDVEHKEDKARALKELAEKFQKEMEEEKQKTLSSALEKFRRDLEEVQRKADEQHQLTHQQQIRKLVEQHQQEISETKKKQWCYNCEAEAIYHCCWNTSYCSVECQQVHWHKEHKRTCRRKRKFRGRSNLRNSKHTKHP